MLFSVLFGWCLLSLCLFALWLFALCPFCVMAVCFMAFCVMPLSVMAICRIGLFPFSFGLMHSWFGRFYFKYWSLNFVIDIPPYIGAQTLSFTQFSMDCNNIVLAFERFKLSKQNVNKDVSKDSLTSTKILLLKHFSLFWEVALYLEPTGKESA